MGDNGSKSPLVLLVQLAIGGVSILVALAGMIHVGVALLALLPGVLGLFAHRSTFLRMSAILASGLNVVFWCYMSIALMADRAVDPNAFVCFLPFAFTWIILCIFSIARLALLSSNADGQETDW